MVYRTGATIHLMAVDSEGMPRDTKPRSPARRSSTLARRSVLLPRVGYLNLRVVQIRSLVGVGSKMPFKSKAQQRKFGAMMGRGEISKQEFDKWAHATPNIKKLPERVGKRPTRSKRGA